MTKVAIAGDWHGGRRFMRFIIPEIAKQGIHEIQHVGDLGLFPDAHSRKFLAELEKLLEKYDITLEVTPGNHENWEWIAKIVKNSSTAVKMPEYSHIFIHPRPEEWERYGRSWTSLSGAPSIDKEERVRGVDWFPEETISTADMEKVFQLPATDILITHDVDISLTPDIEQMISGNPLGFPASSVRYANSGQPAMQAAGRHLQPKRWFHGHYHRAEVSPHRQQQIWSLDMNGTEHNVAILDTDTLLTKWMKYHLY